jgi:hypothetical protein
MENLQAQIENRIDVMVGEVLVLVRQAAHDAINNALSGTTELGKSTTEPKRRKSRVMTLQQRRTPEQLAELAEQLYQQVDKQPGQGMAVYAEALSIPAKDLGVVMRRLRKAGRVRTLGDRDRTRYFPMDPA